MRFGIDLGGTKTEILGLGKDGQEVYRKRIPTRKETYEHIVEDITSLVLEAEQELGQKGTVGVGIPGAVSPKTGLIKNANTTVLIGKPFDGDLTKSLDRPVRIANDANCFTLSEAADGAGKGHQVVFGVIVGTGCGGGIVIDGKIINGVNAIAGEWGHNRLVDVEPEDGEMHPCYCGMKGCIETFISGTGFQRQFKRNCDQDVKAQNIVQRALEGDEQCSAALALLEKQMAKALAGVINILDPDVIVMGGGLSNVQRIYDNIPKHLDRYVFSDSVETKVVRAMHGDSSGVRGAAWLWPEA